MKDEDSLKWHLRSAVDGYRWETLEHFNAVVTIVIEDGEVKQIVID